MEQQNNNVELTRGFKDYEAKLNNLKGIFEKLEGIVNVDEYKEKFAKIIKDVEEDQSINTKMPSNEMQLDYEGLVLAPYIKRLEDLTKELENDILPFYELYLLISKIELQIDKITEDTIDSIISNTIRLVNAINELNTHNIEDKKGIIQKAYNTIYRVILNEEIFDRSEVLDYIKKLDIPANRENIGRLLSNDLDKINKEDIIDDELDKISVEKLGNDFLSHELVRKISISTVGNTSSEYQERKRKAIDEVKKEASALTNRKDNLTEKIKTNNKQITKLKIYRAELFAKAASLVLIPVITLSVGSILGDKKSKKITEYNTITRTIDYDSGNVIGEISSEYEETKSPYTATIHSCTPWRKNPTGIGYIRNITTYEYTPPEDIELNHRINSDDLENNVLEKYTYIETKDNLLETDSTENNVILITETYQDGTTRQSTKFIIPGLIIGTLYGLLIDAVIIMTKIYNVREIKPKIDSLTKDIEEHKLDNKDIEKRLKEMIKEAQEVKDKYNDVVKKYGSWQENFIMDGIDTSWIKKK